MVVLERVQFRLRGGGCEGAIAGCRARLAVEPDCTQAHRHLGLPLAAQGEFGPAFRHMRQACERAPNDSRAWSDRGRVHVMQRKYDEAARSVSTAIHVDPKHADAWHNLGTAVRTIYTKSVERWRAYAPHLRDFERAFQMRGPASAPS